MDYTPSVLKNKGVPAEFFIIKKVSDFEYQREYNEFDEPIREQLNIRFTNNVIADVEDCWGDLESWQTALEKKPITTLRQTLAFVLKRPLEAVGESMIEGETIHYSNAIGVAWALANGVDPLAASKMLKQSNALADEQKRILNDALLQPENETQNSPGKSGSQPGRKRAAPLKSSGN